jgi:hypothetical protein
LCLTLFILLLDIGLATLLFDIAIDFLYLFE